MFLECGLGCGAVCGGGEEERRKRKEEGGTEEEIRDSKAESACEEKGEVR